MACVRTPGVQGSRTALAVHQAAQLLELLRQNTELTRLTQDMSRRIESLTAEIHGQVVRPRAES